MSESVPAVGNIVLLWKGRNRGKPTSGNSGAHCWAGSLVLLAWRISELQPAGPAIPGSPGQHAVGLAQMPGVWPICPVAHPRVDTPSVVKAACLGVDISGTTALIP